MFQIAALIIAISCSGMSSGGSCSGSCNMGGANQPKMSFPVKTSEYLNWQKPAVSGGTCGCGMSECMGGGMNMQPTPSSATPQNKPDAKMDHSKMKM